MPILPSFRNTTPRSRNLEALAFYHGAHSINPQHVIDEIEAKFNRQASEEKKEPLSILHNLEAKLQQVRKERPESEALWLRIRKELGETRPPYFHALIMGFFAVCALLLDAIFIAPTLDIINITEPTFQFIAAVGVAALTTSIFETMGRAFLNARTTAAKRNAILGGALGAFALIVWGLLRGYEIQFAAGLAGNPLGGFLAAHPFLAAVFFIFITIAAPIVGAAALLFAWQEFLNAHTWRRSRKSFESLRTAEVDLARKVQTETEALAEFDKRKAEECREWKAVFAYFYERGSQNGARQQTRASVVSKTVLGTLCAAPLALLVPVAWFPAQLGLLGIASLGCFLFFNHRRIHPSDQEFLKAENTRFAVSDEAKPKAIAAPTTYLLPQGDSPCASSDSSRSTER